MPDRLVAMTREQDPELWEQQQIDAAKLAMFPRLVEALERTVAVLAVQYETRQAHGGAGQQAFDYARALLAEARKLQ